MSLAKIEMFKSLSNMELAKALGKMDKIRLQAGSLLFRQGDAGACMYVIDSGKVRLSMDSEDGTTQPLALLEEADTFGEMALLTGEPRSATARAATDVELYVLDKEAFDRLVLEQPTISAFFISMLSQRLVRTNDLLQASGEENARQVARALDKLPDDRKEALIDCAVFPRFDRGVLRATHGPELAEALIGGLSGERFLAEAVDVGEGAGAGSFAFPAAVRSAVRQLFDETRTVERKNRLKAIAASHWTEAGDWQAAIATYAEDGEWAIALELAEKAPGERLDERSWALLDRCPPAPLFARFAVLERYLLFCAANARADGLAKADAAIGESPSPFTARQKIALCERGAELAEKLGRTSKSVEWLTLAEALNEAATGPYAAAGPSSGEAEERAYRSAKTKLERQKAGELASKAGRLLPSRALSLVLALLAAAASLLFFHFAPSIGGLSREGMDFIGIGLAAVFLWIANVVADYVVALLMAMGWVLGGLVTPETALSGFASTTWLYMLFILAFGAVISKSGILYRLSLHALKRFPPTYRGQLWGIVAGGALLNPLIPSSSAKVALGVPIARTLTEAMGFRERSRESAGLGLTAMVFYGFTAPFMLTGSYSNALAFGLADGGKMPGWFQWFLYALPAFLAFSAVMLGVLFLTFRGAGSQAARPVSRQALDDQLKLLGKLSKQERTTLLTVAGSLALLIAQPLHGLDNAWVMLLGFAVLVVTNTLDGQTLKLGVDWTFLLFIGIAFSFAAGAKQLGVVEALSEFLGGRMGPFLSSPALFLSAAMLVSFAATFVVRDDPALILLVVALLPLAEQAGVHPWVLVFVVLLCTDPFFFPYQSPTYLTAYYSAEGRSFDHRQGRKIALGYAAAVAVSVLASLPYWHWIGLIR